MAPIFKSISEKVEDVTREGRLLIAINAIGNEDADGDISMPGSFNKTLKNDIDRVKWYLNHNQTILLGVPISGYEENGLVKMSTQLNMKKQICLDVLSDYELYAEYGRTLEHSVGVEDVIRNKSNTKEVLEWKLWEYSTLTSWGANPNTPLLEMKNATTDEQIKMLEKALKKNYSDERLQTIEKSLNLLKKAVLGENIVKCPYCGLVFDYNSVHEVSFEENIIESATRYAQWMIDDVVWEEVHKLEPEVAQPVMSIIQKQKTMKTKSIEDLVRYVYCPKCYNQVHRVDVVETATEEKSFTGLKGLGKKFLKA